MANRARWEDFRLGAHEPAGSWDHVVPSESRWLSARPLRTELERFARLQALSSGGLCNPHSTPPGLLAPRDLTQLVPIRLRVVTAVTNSASLCRQCDKWQGHAWWSTGMSCARVFEQVRYVQGVRNPLLGRSPLAPRIRQRQCRQSGAQGQGKIHGCLEHEACSLKNHATALAPAHGLGL
jgi:hypothetical protein